MPVAVAEVRGVWAQCTFPRRSRPRLSCSVRVGHPPAVLVALQGRVLREEYPQFLQLTPDREPLSQEALASNRGDRPRVSLCTVPWLLAEGEVRSDGLLWGGALTVSVGAVLPPVTAQVCVAEPLQGG